MGCSVVSSIVPVGAALFPPQTWTFTSFGLRVFFFYLCPPSHHPPTGRPHLLFFYLWADEWPRGVSLFLFLRILPLPPRRPHQPPGRRTGTGTSVSSVSGAFGSRPDDRCAAVSRCSPWPVHSSTVPSEPKSVSSSVPRPCNGCHPLFTQNSVVDASRMWSLTVNT